MKKLPTQEYIRECLSYNSKTGELTWKRRPPEHFAKLATYKGWNARWEGKPAFTSEMRDKTGKLFALQGLINGVNYYTHRIIWKGVTGQDPVFDVDHRDRDPSNNRWLNLRSATRQQNNRNQGLQTNNSSGHTGVCPRNDLWIAYIYSGDAPAMLGRFEDKESAIQARRKAEKKLFGEFRAC